MTAKTVALPKPALLQLDLVLTVGSFLIPLLVSGPQWLTGTLVNFLLFAFVSELPKKNILPIVVLPSLGAVAHGVLFGSYTPFLLYFLPFIWLGNFVLVSTYKAISRSVSPFVGVLLGSTAKVVIMYAAALIYFQLSIVPSLFLTAMGMMQFYTALAGGTLLIIVRNFIKST
ncbi:hypothetical protein IPM65_02165 [Candidatus Roizmanbacteria bacterium]|nr:MAG: hypothetical protein IPM65_02165 [Candidatus Roizmanbacteria bacterium]